jgi:hypothetical protein
MPDTSRPSVREIVLVPALIALAVTIVRLVGELQHGDARLFNRAGGGQGAIVGISWLPFLFGIYFAVRLVRAGEGPSSKGRAVLMPVLGLVLTGAAIVGAFKSGASQNAQILVICVAAVLGGWVASLGWGALGKVSFVYALASRVPVAVLMYFAIAGKWGTHYDALPPNFPAMSPAATWALVGLLPQMTLWIGFTLLPACLLGGITAAVMGGGRRNAVANAA